MTKLKAQVLDALGICSLYFVFACFAVPAVACQNSPDTQMLELREYDDRGARLIELCVGQIISFQMSEPLGAVVVGLPDVVATNILTPDRAVFTAVQPGETSMVAVSADRMRDAMISFSVRPASSLGAARTTSNLKGEGTEVVAEEPLGKEITVWRGTVASTVVCTTTCNQ